MKTKTLLIAAAALAAGVISSQAQVYSQNIVGYVSRSVTAGQNTCLANPLICGSNSATNIFGAQLPDGTQLFQWTGTGYIVSGYDASIGANPDNWYTGGFDDVAPTPVIKTGEGFFLFNSAKSFTNTFVGQVAINTGATATNHAVAGINNLLGSIYPVGGSLTNTVINFFPPDGTQLFQWTGTGYVVSGYDASIGANPDNWYTGGFDDVAPTPVIKVGDGYFIFNSASSWDWKQTGL